MIFTNLSKKIGFVLKQNFKKQKFRKEYNIRFDSEIENFIKNYSSLIPKNLDINRNLDLLSNIKYEDRKKNYDIVKNAINKFKEINLEQDIEIQNNLKELEEEGITDLNFIKIPEIKINNMLSKLDNLERYKGHTIHHSEGHSLKKNDMKNNSFYCFETSKIIEIEEILEILNNNKLKQFVIRYFKCLPTLNSLNVYTTTKTEVEQGVQNYHRDNEDFKTLNIFFLLKDSKKNDGGHAFIKGSHDPNSLRKKVDENKFQEIKNVAKKYYNLELNSIDEICNMPKDGYGFEKIYNLLSDNEIDVYGKAGKIFAEDNFGLHKSIKNKNERIIFWLSFSLTSVGTTRYCISHNILRKFIPMRIGYSNINKQINNDFIERYMYRYYINYSK